LSATNFTKQSESSFAEEQIKIYFSDDEKIKSFGEILTSDAGRLILKMLLQEELTANQISQKSGISLQLVKYHVNKMQRLGIISISKTEKNSKAHDMKFYAAAKFAIMILPQNEQEKNNPTVHSLLQEGLKDYHNRNWSSLCMDRNTSWPEHACNKGDSTKNWPCCIHSGPC
jgi:predicted transcriptional regulator